MSKFYLLVIVFWAFFSANASADNQICSKDKRMVEPCFKLHGSMMIMANGKMKINPQGTKTLLGIDETSESGNGEMKIPYNVNAILSNDPEAEIVGDFTVCPFTKEVKGKLRQVCLDKAENVDVIAKDKSKNN